MVEKGNILKVTIEFENEILIVDGEEVLKWKKMVDGMSSFCNTHGVGYPVLNWKIFTKQEKVCDK